jgi:hypothetical protein
VPGTEENLIKVTFLSDSAYYEDSKEMWRKISKKLVEHQPLDEQSKMESTRSVTLMRMRTFGPHFLPCQNYRDAT